MSSDGFVVKITKFDTEFSKDPAFSTTSLLYELSEAWSLDQKNHKYIIDPSYQSLLCDNLLERITNTQQRLQLITEDRWNVTSAENENHNLLEVVLKDEKLTLATLQLFVDDLVGIAPMGLMGLQVLLDARYEENPGACSSPWPLQPSVALPFPPPKLVSVDPALRSVVASDIPSDAAPVLPLPAAVTPSLHQHYTSDATPIPALLSPQRQPPSPDASCFGLVVARLKRRLNRTRR
ncbi:hypothetical protein BJ165DRAFT_1496141 [Panaeolus papilionaceus]|nr:hypothetical protein BJ165DRAFT_1496141 [Panaeolus papilionaceus]